MTNPIQKLRLKLFLAILALCAMGLLGYWALGSRPSQEPRQVVPGPQEAAQGVSPADWYKWFMKGRRTRDGRSAAAHREEAKAHAHRMPSVSPGMPFNLSVKSAKTTCDWTELGPKPGNDPGGDGHVSGRVTSLALDLTNDPTGNTLYLGSAYGGVWKTTNALAASPSYLPLSNPTQSLAVGALAVDGSHNPPYLFVGTGEANMAGDSYYGVGLLRSTDGGGSWSQISTATSGGGSVTFLGVTFSKVLVDPSHPATVLAATAFGCCEGGLSQTNVGNAKGLFYSSDSGATWTQVNNSNITTRSCTDIVYDGSATFFAAVRGVGLFYSTDAITWTALPSPFPSGTAVTPISNTATSNFGRASLASRGTTLWCLEADSNGNPSTPVVGTDTGLSQSVDGGHTWTSVDLPSVSINLYDAGAGAQGDYDQYVAAPPGSTALLVAGIDVWKTSAVNGTSTGWTNLTNAYSGAPSSHPDQHAVAMAGAVTWVLGNDGGVWSTNNAGTVLSNINTDLGTIQFYGASPDPNHGGSYAGGSQDNGTFYTDTSRGVTWTEVYGGDGVFTDFNGGVPGEIFAENFNVGLYRDDNYGANGFNTTVLSKSNVGNENSSFDVPYKVLSGVPGQIVLGASHVWRGPANASNGSGWGAISQNLLGADSGFVVALDTGTSNTNYIYATTEDDTSGQYHVFSNGGASGLTTWTDITGTLPNTSPIAGIAVDPTAPTTVYVGIQGFVGSAGVSHVYQSINGGTSWMDITGNLPDAPVNWILVDLQFNTDVYVATDVGVFYTHAVSGGSTSWSRVGTVLPDSTVLQLKMGACPNRTIVAATHGRGAWSICPISTYTCPSPTATFTPTITFTPTNTPVSVPFVAQAQPNVTDGQNPVNFVVGLPRSMTVQLVVYNVADEAVYSQPFPGNTGNNTIPWKPQNQNGQPLASGVYIYHLRAEDGTGHYDKVGKILVRR